MLLIRKRRPSPETLYVNVVKNRQAEQNDGQNV